MDKVQELLIKKGHKDLAEEYYEKVARVKSYGTYVLKVDTGKEFKFPTHEKAVAFIRKNKGKYNRIKMEYFPKANKEEQKKTAKDMCPESGCIGKKPNGKWGVVSNKTGDWWPANYDTKEKAESALKAYHVHN